MGGQAVKFLCDRCKTRYSIGDDRVRGKILKIRCKNCANVITVREGMTDGSEAERRGHPTTGAPPAGTPAPQGALGAAFAQQLAKPPPALEEEWYVSIDGEQSGPFSLTEAQRWVSAKPFDADLHCWSEGFDDWLPVDKVSHFRGLRQRPKAPTAPPPMPRAATRQQPAIAARPPPTPEPEPKPLFAATMAALERDSEKVKMPPQVAAMSTPAPAPRANGTAAQAAISVPAAIKPALPSLSKPAAKLPSPSGSKPANGGHVSAGAKALAEAFDIPSPGDAGDSMTAVEAPAFNDDIPTTAEPHAAKRVDTPPAVKPVFAPEPDGDDEDDSLNIGEVSRVVSLADIAKMGRSSGAQKPIGAQTGPQTPIGAQTGTQRALNATGSVPRLNRTASHAKLPMNEVVPNMTGPFEPLPAMPGMPGAIVPSESVVAAAPARVHRRGLILLLGAAGVLLAGVVIAVVLLVQSNDETPSELGRQTEYDTSRPDDPNPRPRNPLEAVANTGAMGSAAIVRPRPRPQQLTTTHPETPEIPGQSRLKPDEIEDMAAKQGEGTKRCYMRAQKGALGLDVADIKKIDVMLTVDKDGTVTDVQLSDHGADNFGKCLIARIRGWKFRQSPGGTFKIALAFSNG